MLRAFRFWLISSGVWLTLFMLFLFWERDQYAGAEWMAGYAFIVVGVLPCLALLPPALALGWLLGRRNRRAD